MCEWLMSEEDVSKRAKPARDVEVVTGGRVAGNGFFRPCCFEGRKGGPHEEDERGTNGFEECYSTANREGGCLPDTSYPGVWTEFEFV